MSDASAVQDLSLFGNGQFMLDLKWVNRLSVYIAALQLLVISFIAGSANSVAADDDPEAAYVFGDDSMQHADVPQGVMHKGLWTSRVFEGTIREYSVYVPAQYDHGRPTCLMVFQDGHAYADRSGQFRVPVVMDNLSHKGELPVIISVFINPGHKGEVVPENPWRPNNRSFEYDTLSDQYSRFVVEELLPFLSKEYELNISSDPLDRAIGGISSGGICAFTAAWEHPEWFSKVLSHVGSFTNIRGGHNYEAMIRKTDRKPIRVFLQDGSNDLNNEHGNWWLANLQMESSLAFKGYDFKFVGGTGKHSGKHGGAILPESLKWLWRDHTASSRPDGNEQRVKAESIDAATIYEAKSIRFTGGEYDDEEFKYRLLRPLVVGAGQKFPLVVFLHGAGERGTDNVKQLQYLPAQMILPTWRERFPCYLLAPQCREERKWVEVDWSAKEDPVFPTEPGTQLTAVIQMIETTLKNEQVDTDRIYVTGLSMGGFGTWDLATRRPDWFAAIAPICGGADTTRIDALASKPVWIVHGDQDSAVPVDRGRSANAALLKAGGHPTYIEMPGVGHNSWTPAYSEEDGLISWMFKQKKTNIQP